MRADLLQRIQIGAGLSTVRCIAEKPVASLDDKRTNQIFAVTVVYQMGIIGEQSVKGITENLDWFMP